MLADLSVYTFALADKKLSSVLCVIKQNTKVNKLNENLAYAIVTNCHWQVIKVHSQILFILLPKLKCHRLLTHSYVEANAEIYDCTVLSIKFRSSRFCECADARFAHNNILMAQYRNRSRLPTIGYP